MLTLAMSKCPSSVDIQQYPSSTTNHQMSSFKGGGAVTAIDYRSHQPNAKAPSSRFDYNSLQKQTSATPSAYLIESGDEHNPTAVALNSMYQCSDVMCNNTNGSRLFNRRSLTLMRPPSSSMAATTAAAAAATMANASANVAANGSNLYKDQYLRQLTSKLPKLQSFISTPDLTSDSSLADDANCTDELDEQMLALMPPPPPAMPLLTSKTLLATAANSASDFARPDVIQLHTFRCFHHHKHNQAGAAQTKSTTKESTANANETSGKQTEPASGKV